MNETTNQVIIKGVTYNVVYERPVANQPGRTWVGLQRPRGTKGYLVVRDERGNYSTPIAV